MKTYRVKEPELGTDLLSGLRRPINSTALYSAAYDAAIEIERLQTRCDLFRTALVLSRQQLAAALRANDRMRKALQRIADLPLVDRKEAKRKSPVRISARRLAVNALKLK